jgi:hypothetical protein
VINDPKSFCYWLQGYFELGGENLSPQQVQIIKDHLALVFNKVTPSYNLGVETVPQEQTYCGSNHPSYGGVIPLNNTNPTGLIYFTPQISEANRVDTAKLIRVC